MHVVQAGTFTVVPPGALAGLLYFFGIARCRIQRTSTSPIRVEIRSPVDVKVIKTSQVGNVFFLKKYLSAPQNLLLEILQAQLSCTILLSMIL